MRDLNDPRVKQLAKLYEQMHSLTLPKCAQGCISKRFRAMGQVGVPHNCCNGVQCSAMMEYAKRTYGFEYIPTGHPDLPMLGPEGCIMKPYMRPSCTVHNCRINGMGIDPDSPEWTTEYFRLRDELEQLEYEIGEL